MGTSFEISEINRIVELIKKVNCANYASVAETAKEMGVKKTALMQYIEDNPKLFTLVEVQKPKAGLAIKFAYLTPETNPATEEWIELKKKEWEKKINVSGQYYYNQLEFHFIAEDDIKSIWREGLWRNTKEKIQKLVDDELIKIQKSGYGGFGDYYKWEGYLLDIETTNKLKEAGWELIYPENDK